MPTKATLNAQLNRATKAREALDGETITIGGTAYVGTFSTIEDSFGIDDTGLDGRERLHGTLRIDQFLDDPTTFDPAANYTANQPANQTTVTLRARPWRIEDIRRGHDSFLFTMIEARPRS